MTYQKFQFGPDRRDANRLGENNGQIHIVVADDHPIVREGVVASLKRERHLKVHWRGE